MAVHKAMEPRSIPVALRPGASARMTKPPWLTSRRHRTRLSRVLPLVLISVGLALPVLVSASPAPAAIGAQASGCSPLVHIAGSVDWPAPRWTDCLGGAIAQSSPSIATVDGMTVVAIGDENGYVHLLNATTGRELPGWPQRVATPPGARAAIETSPTFGWLDGPNEPPSIIVGSGSTWVSSSVGEVEAFRFDGSHRFVFRVGAAAFTAHGVISTPAVGDLTGSGQQDIVFGSWDHYLYALTPSGSLVSGFPINNRDTVWSSPTLYHRRGLIGDDLYVGSDASGWQGCYGGWVSDYRYESGAPHLVWQRCTEQAIWSSPTVGVLSNPRRPVVVVGTGWYLRRPPILPAGSNEVFAFDALNGATRPGWPVKMPGPTSGSPAIGQLVAGAAPSVVETSWVCSGPTQPSCFSGNDSVVDAFAANGHVQWSRRLLGPTVIGSPVLVPLRGQTANDVLVGTPNALYPLSGETGAYLFGTNGTNQFAAINPGCRMFNTPAVGYVGGSGWRLFEACGGPAAFSVPGRVVSYALPMAPAGVPAWPMFRGGPDHLGVAGSTFPGVTTTDLNAWSASTTLFVPESSGPRDRGPEGVG